MFRAILFSIVFSLAGGQNASLLCRVWCDPGAAAASGCHDAGNSTDRPNLIGADSCDDGLPGGATYLKEDVQRSVSTADADHALPAPRYQLAPPMTGTRLDREPTRLPSREKRPLETALRI